MACHSARPRFYKCKRLTRVNIPKNLTDIFPWAFDKCTGLQNIDVAKNNARYSSINGVLYDKSGKKLIHCPCGKQGILAVPAGVTEISLWAFYGCAKLTKVVIPKSVKLIDDTDVFIGCSRLKQISVDANNADYCSSEGILYDKKKKKLFFCPGGKAGRVTIPKSVTEINIRAFVECKDLTIISCLSTTPPNADGAFDEDVCARGKLCVPKDAVAAYKSAEGWRDFKTIVPDAAGR